MLRVYRFAVWCFASIASRSLGLVLRIFLLRNLPGFLRQRPQGARQATTGSKTDSPDSEGCINKCSDNLSPQAWVVSCRDYCNIWFIPVGDGQNKIDDLCTGV